MPCRTCGETGHYAKRCDALLHIRQPAKETKRAIHCGICALTGHTYKRCPLGTADGPALMAYNINALLKAETNILHLKYSSDETDRAKVAGFPLGEILCAIKCRSDWFGWDDNASCGEGLGSKTPYAIAYKAYHSARLNGTTGADLDALKATWDIEEKREYKDPHTPDDDADSVSSDDTDSSCDSDSTDDYDFEDLGFKIARDGCVLKCFNPIDFKYKYALDRSSNWYRTAVCY